MTTPYASLPTPPERNDDLAAFYPDWAGQASGYEAERAFYDKLAADIARARRARSRQVLMACLRRTWWALADRFRSPRPAADRDRSPPAISEPGRS